MKKLLGISVIAMLAVSPLAANAAAVAGDATHYSGDTPNSVRSAVEPEFALVESHANDSKAASAGYVKGAYNAAIKAINKVNANVNSNLATTGGAGIDKTGNVLSVDTATNGGLEMSGGGNTAKLTVKAGNGVELGSGGVAVKAKTNAGIAVDSNGVAVDAGNGISLDSNGVNVQAKDGSIVVDASGVSVGLTSNGGIVQNATNKTLEVKVDDSTIAVDSTSGAIKIKNGVQAASDTTTYGGTGLTTKGYVDEAVAGLNISNYATKTGVDNAIENASITLSVGNDFTLSNGAVSGSVTVPIMDTWGSDTPASTELAATTSLSVGTAITEGTVTVSNIDADYATANTAAPAQGG